MIIQLIKNGLDNLLVGVEVFNLGYGMNCSTIKTLVKGYFTPAMSVEIRDEIVSHLVVCDDCRKVYADYAKSIGLKFDINQEIMKVYNLYNMQKPELGISDIMLTDVISDGQLEEIVKSRDTFYTRRAKKRDIEGVMNVRAVRDLTFEKICIGNDEVEKFSDFAWYLVENICRKVDILNNLYELSGGKEEGV